MNLRLKVALALSTEPAWQIAKRAGLHRTTLSAILHEHRTPSARERAAIANALNKPEEELFEPLASEPVGA